MEKIKQYQGDLGKCEVSGVGDGVKSVGWESK